MWDIVINISNVREQHELSPLSFILVPRLSLAQLVWTKYIQTSYLWFY